MRWGSGRTIALFVAAIKNGLISDSRPHITGLPDAQFYRLDLRGQRLTLPLHARIKRGKKRNSIVFVHGLHTYCIASHVEKEKMQRWAKSEERKRKI